MDRTLAFHVVALFGVVLLVTPAESSDPCEDASLCGQWLPFPCEIIGGNEAFGTQAIHAALLHTGKILLWGYTGGETFYGAGYLWTPDPNRTGCGVWEVTEIRRLHQGPIWPGGHGPSGVPGCPIDVNHPMDVYSPFCSGHDFDFDGRLLLASGVENHSGAVGQTGPAGGVGQTSPGGGADHPGAHIHSFHTLWFDPASESWVGEAHLSRQRWYPTVRLHPTSGSMYAWNGNVGSCREDLAFPPLLESTQFPERLVPGTSWISLLGAGGTPCHPMMDMYAPGSMVVPSPVWPEKEGQDHWLFVSQDNYSGPAQTWLIDPENGGSGCNFINLNRPASYVHQHGAETLAPFEYNDLGGYLPGPSIYLIGGYQGGCGTFEPHANVEYLNALTSTWELKTQLSHARQDHNAVLLPDGKIFVVGGGKAAQCCAGEPNYPICDDGVPSGGDCAQLVPEIYDPTRNTWTDVAQHQKPRVYHSTALLLPDGSVFVAGGEDRVGNVCAPDYYSRETSLEIYMPPYFFPAASRPEITRMPDPPSPGAIPEVPHNTSFTIRVRLWDPGDSRVLLIRQGSVTHGHQMSSRTIDLPIVSESNTLGGEYDVTLRMPPLESTVAPAGYYLLWVVRDWTAPDGLSGSRRPCTMAQWIRVPPVSSASTEPPSALPPGVRLSASQHPFTAEVEMLIEIPEPSPAGHLDIYSVSGRHVARIADSLPAGHHRIVWDGTSAAGNTVSSGVYVARLELGSGQPCSEKFVLIR